MTGAGSARGARQRRIPHRHAPRAPPLRRSESARPQCRKAAERGSTCGNCGRSSTYAENVTRAWDPATAGVLRLPSGRLIRGRGLRRPALAAGRPDFGLYLLGRPPPPVGWEQRWVRWPDFRLPSDKRDALDALSEAWWRAGSERVEIACRGGRGKAGQVRPSHA
ncbi:hypothetical protein BN11_4980008 [Nostocoides australiense Ben110]|uniref:Protein phosphatase n=1 Tax=Nostocoides australiense Ben110 TaxID=1193182 RepID=W6K4F7_9MICO|nr:hypothetical protein BN11_4980008 [Tetrasphaera australiensis Ben110]